MTINAVRKTTDDKVAGSIRLFLGVMFLMTGAMKLFVPALAEAWSGQLIAAELPFYELTRRAVPILEIALGAVLAVGVFVRPAVLMVTGIMGVATYVHVVVNDPVLFPLQPSEPIIPLVVVALSAYIFWKGSGSWSRDLKVAQA